MTSQLPPAADPPLLSGYVLDHLVIQYVTKNESIDIKRVDLLGWYNIYMFRLPLWWLYIKRSMSLVKDTMHPGDGAIRGKQKSVFQSPLMPVALPLTIFGVPPPL
jgi:hypothetical protein